ncbi:hypothetical protein D3C72_1919500 [compost metagenome]
MRVDQARHQGAAAAVDDPRAVGGDFLPGYFLDDIAMHQHVARGAQLGRRAVENAHILKQDPGLRGDLGLAGLGLGCLELLCRRRQFVRESCRGTE